MDLKLDETLKSLIDLGKRSGYLTWDQVNAQIPPDTVEPDRLDQILELLDQHGISIIEEDQAEERQAQTPPADPAEERSPAGHRRRLRGGRRRQAHGRPRPHVPDPDGRDPPAGPRQGNQPRQEDRSHPPVVPPQGAGVRFRPPAASTTSSSRVHAEELPFDRTIKISQTEKLEKDMILKRMPHNLRTIEPLMDHNAADFDRLIHARPRLGRGAARTPPPHQVAPQEGRHADRRTQHPHAEDRAADEEDGGRSPSG